MTSEPIKPPESQPPYSEEVAKIVATGLLLQRASLIESVRGVHDGYHYRTACLNKLQEQIQRIDSMLEDVMKLGMKEPPQ